MRNIAFIFARETLDRGDDHIGRDARRILNGAYILNEGWPKRVRNWPSNVASRTRRRLGALLSPTPIWRDTFDAVRRSMRSFRKRSTQITKPTAMTTGCSMKLSKADAY